MSRHSADATTAPIAHSTPGGEPGLRTLVLLRHGQSVWNRDGIFSGWVDIGLSDRGRAEAVEAGRLLAASGIAFDHCFTSVLKRAVQTLWIVLEEIDLPWLPVSCSWRLNERHYGALQGRSKERTRDEYGESQVLAWRRSFPARPPPLDDAAAAVQEGDRRYAAVPRRQMPRAESLEDTLTRVLPYWHERLEPLLMGGRTPLVVAHGNTLRAIVKYLDGIADDDVVGIEIPTARPLIYQLDGGLTPVRRRYLDDSALR